MEDSYTLLLSKRKFSGLYLCFCGYSKCKALHNFGPAVRTNYIIHFILEGKGNYCVDENKYNLKAGEGFLIEPEVQTFYQADAVNPWSYLWVGFDGERAEEYLRDIGLNHKQLTFSFTKLDEVKALVLEMLKHNTASLANEFLLEGLLYQLFAILSEGIIGIDIKYQNQENQYIRQAINYIQNNYFDGIGVQDVADYIGITRNYLYTLFQKNLKMSPKEFLTNYRITLSTDMLTLTDLSIEGVAFSCGYKDSLVFAKVFKQYFKMSPSEYRKTRREEADSKLKNINRN